MKLSISLPDEDVQFLDAYAASAGFASRSAVLHRAVRLLRATELGPAYEAAFAEWEKSGVAGKWDATTADGLRPDAPR
ncbi:MAG TPA: ribbon-helix-helix domain-containing protein [Gaiellaceae bacterium]|nr:ribbon-helix-helix domain-containing protein [Gaiellaceae bacterium]